MPVVYDEVTKESRYLSLHENILMCKSNKLLTQFFKYAEANGLTPNDVIIQRALLPRVSLRVDKRKSYFLVFHDRTRINEVKEAALTSYWILKMKPFMVKTDNVEMAHKHSFINEGFAAFYLFSSLTQCAKEKGHKATQMSDHLMHELMYAFKYWDLSKEAIILIAETLGEAFYGIEAQGVEDNHEYNK